MAYRPAVIAANIRRLFLVVGVSALGGVVMAGLALPVVGGLGISAREGADAFLEMPSELDTPPLAQRSRITDSSGATIATFYDENRITVGLDQIAPVMQDAILAIEDDRFYERGPIDFQGTVRALIRNVESGETQGGGSTLTQQYVKQVRIDAANGDKEKIAEVQASSGIEGYKRKLEELRMAVSIEQDYSKDEILERYLNIAYFGSGAYGVEAAARTYFSTSAAELTLSQAAMLAGLVQAPADYDPTRNPDAALSRRNVVLDRMAETGRITEAEAAEASATDLGLVLSPSNNGCVDTWAGYFCDYVVQEIMNMEELGATPQERRDLLYRGGLTITTTLDKKTQQAAQNAVSDQVAPTDSAIASTASVEPGTGYIKAMANSRIYGVEGEGVSQINYAVDESMGGGKGIQPGSSFKPFVLAAAIDQGIGLDTRIRSPQTITVPEKSFTTCKGRYPSNQSYTVKNSTGSGTFNLKTGTERSVNTFYVQLLQRTGICQPATIAKDAGITRAYLDSDGNELDLAQVPSFALGSNEVSPLSMAEGYATFANRGVHCESKAVLTVTDSTGKVLADNTEPTCNEVVEPEVADAVNSVLQGVIHNPGGTGGRMKLDDGRIAAGKTGTTNNSVAVWFVGYVPQLSTAVAVADVDGEQTTLDGRTYNGERINEACGGCIPGPIWKDLMDTALDGMPKEKFTAPDPKTVKGVTVSVPDVRGMSAESAIARLEEAGFSASVAGEVASDIPKGLVVYTDPGAGAAAGSGSSIGVYVSSGQPPAPPPPPPPPPESNNGNGENSPPAPDNGAPETTEPTPFETPGN